MQESAAMKRPASVAAHCLVLLMVVSCASAPDNDRLLVDSAPRPENDVAFRRANTVPIVTFRITGENVRETQVSLYRSQSNGITFAQIKEYGKQKAARLVSSQTEPEIGVLFDTFSKLSVSPYVDDVLYLPGMTIEVWVSGLVGESYFKIRLPNEASDGDAYWGNPSMRSTALVEWVRRLSSVVKAFDTSKSDVAD